MAKLIHWLVEKELGEDPNDFFIHWLLTHNIPLILDTALKVSLVVIVVGVVKLIIAYGIWQHSHRAQIMSLVLVGCLGLAGLIDTIHLFSWFKVIAVFVDGLLFYYLAFILPKHISLDATLKQE